MAEKRTTDKKERKQTHFIPTKRLSHYEVIDGAGQLMGKVEQIIVDMCSGRVAYYLVSTEGLARRHDEWLAMPPDVLTWYPEKLHFTTPILSIDLDDAPSIPKADWPDTVVAELQNVDETQARLDSICAYYNVTPFRVHPRRDELQPQAPALADFLPVSHLKYYDVINEQGEDMGQVQEFVLDMAADQLAYVVVAFGGTLGLTDKWIAMPFDILTWQPETHKLKLDASRSVLENAPGINKDDWPDKFLSDLADEEEHAAWVETIYVHFECSPYWVC